MTMIILRHRLIAAGVLGLALGLPAGAGAVPVTSLSGATALSMPALNIFGNGPQTLASGIVWTSSSTDSAYGYTDGYDFEGNGRWDYRKTAVVSNVDNGTMTFTFGTAVAGFGGLLNWAPGYSPASIAAYDASGRLIESSAVSFLTGGGLNSGQFMGFLESAAIIKRFTLTGGWIGGTDFQVVSTAAAVPAVPEPSTWGLSLAGLGALALAVRRRAKGG